MMATADDIDFRLIFETTGTDAIDRLTKAIEAGEEPPGELRLTKTEESSEILGLDGSVRPGHVVRTHLYYDLIEIAL
jgi:hypothetical protein